MTSSFSHVYPDTPLFRQYKELRAQAGVALLFFRLGDFYELFGDQAELASRLLGVTLTSRDKNRPDPLPMCGIPAKSLDLYLPKLIHAGYAVAIAEQASTGVDPSGLFPREIVRTVTRFTLLEDPSREEGSPQNGIALIKRGDAWGAACLDLTSGRISVWSPVTHDDFDGLRDWLERKEAREIILETSELADQFTGIPTRVFDRHREDDFSSWLPSSYHLPTLPTPTIEALRLLFGFLSTHERTVLEHLRGIDLEGASPSLLIDRWTLRHLDVLPGDTPAGDGRKVASLVSLLDYCRTPMGSRTLRRWLLSPDSLLDPIVSKHRVIRGLSVHPRLPEKMIFCLRGVGDLERILARLSMGQRLPRDLAEFRRSFRNSLELAKISELRSLFSEERPIQELVDAGMPLLDLLERALEEEPALVLGDGPIIRDSFDNELAGYRRIEAEGDSFLADLEERERKRTGVENLRIRYNQLAGYYIEVSRAQGRQMPENYLRKQTLTNTERFTISELVEFEGSLRESRSRVLGREGEILEDLRRKVLNGREIIHHLADYVSRADVLLSFFENGRLRGYVIPEFISSEEPLVLKNGRHPVLESRLDPGQFMPNDTELSEGEFIVLTGPNMAGKSTYMRQIALIVLMAQAGSPVPADLARLPLVDRVIARVGASDNIMEGASTFMVEMTEVARILSSATTRSLVLLDEVGRGTATYDGMAIAWAVSEFIHDRIRCRTIFATHYHELSELARTHARVRNQTVRVSIREGSLVFEHRIIDGRAEQSYGIEVAKLAGLPSEVIDRASEVLSFWEAGQPRRVIPKNRTLPPDRDFSMPLFSWKQRIANDKIKEAERPEELKRRRD